MPSLFKNSALKRLLQVALCACAALHSVQGRTADARTVYVGGVSSSFPSSYVDGSNQLAGFDIDVLKAANELLPQLRFVYRPMELTALFVGLDARRLDLIAGSFSKNEERERKYLFTTGYLNNDAYLVVRAGRADIASLADLKGRTVEVWGPAVSDFAFFNAHNRAHPDQAVNILRTNGDPVVLLKNLADGRADAFVASRGTVARLKSDLHAAIEVVGKAPLLPGAAHFILRRDETQLKAELDRALRQLAANGTLRRLSLKWWGEDLASRSGE